MTTARRLDDDGARLRLALKGKESLADELGYFGQSVSPRTGAAKRDQAELEDYCMRRWLIAMLASGRLSYPVVIEAFVNKASEARKIPDFLVQAADGEAVGVEVTSAGSATWNKWLTATEDNEIHLYPNEDGYVRPDRIVIDDIARQISKKSEKARSGLYDGVRTTDLLIYENSEGGLFVKSDEIVARLRGGDFTALRDAGRAFARVHIIFGQTVYLDVFGNDCIPVDLSTHHANDWSGWLREQAERLKARDTASIDFDNLAEELEALSRSDKRKLKSQLLRLMTHLLKRDYQPDRRTRSWAVSIGGARREIEEQIEENPSLERELKELSEQAYAKAREWAKNETRLPISKFPASCPWTVDELLGREALKDQADG